MNCIEGAVLNFDKSLNIVVKILKKSSLNISVFNPFLRFISEYLTHSTKLDFQNWSQFDQRDSYTKFLCRAKNFTKCVFYHVKFSGVIQNIAYHPAIFTLFVYVDYYQNNQFY